MQCEAIRPLIRTFLDDLLDEKDYQDIQTHLTGCERCHSYASSVGTLSYRLYELGQVSVPLDMSSAILYEFGKHTHSLPAGAAKSLLDKNIPTNNTAAGTRLLWVAIIVVLVSAVVAFVTVVSVSRLRTAGPITEARTLPTPSSEPVKQMSTPVPVIRENMPKEITSHWHYHAAKSDLGELKVIFEELYLTVLDESPSHLVFYVPAERQGNFVTRMAGLSGIVKEYGEVEPAPAGAAVQVSIYLE